MTNHQRAHVRAITETMLALAFLLLCLSVPDNIVLRVTAWIGALIMYLILTTPKQDYLLDRRSKRREP